MILLGDAITRLAELPDESVQCCITSPPYWGLRDYGVDDQLGLEKTPALYVAKLREVFAQVKRVLKDDGTLWLVIGDTYISSGGAGHQGLHGERFNRTHTQRNLLGNSAAATGLKAKDLVGIPWRVAFALQDDGWYLRQDIIWQKPNPMPESVRDRCTKAHEYVFLLSKSPKYYFNVDAIKEPAVYAGRRRDQKKGEFKAKGEPLPGRLPFRAIRDTRQKRSVWSVASKPFKGAHFATFPPALIEPCVLAGSQPGDTILDPFFGAGTVGLVAMKHQRKWIGIEINSDYRDLAKARLDLNP